MVAKHILRGPSSALERPGYKRGKRGNASLMGLKSVNPYIIAYVAVQARFAISSQDQWSSVDGQFNYETFYWFIVGIFDDGEGLELIKHYNHHVFGDELEGDQLAAMTVEPELSDFELMKAQRLAKRVRLST
ncbi:hypothetical protein HYPSUDRAFT_396288 [Hypholoma sublateritium FD-334 SS-4]|uniref:Fungal-type protein kinase domain-containing protein n=1 Tax=Hypholoma sublateritium (strain FD-334 SS-4) TaxID=945553 RepID=A0A0D2N809_HYPSF|nr:hypothetical protein HYPSUDRAFT_396288 [Hypholoma sublateritium FD-334 SS-4]